MDREFKIVISIFSFFLIFGLGSLFKSGAFETPIFFNQIIFLVISLIFWLMNRKVDHAWILPVFVLVQLIACLIDPFIMGYLYERKQIELAREIFDSNLISWLFLISYFGFMLFLSIFSFKKHQLTYILLINLILLAATIIFLLQPELKIDSTFTFFGFLVLFYLTVNRLMPSNHKVLSVLSNQFLLILMLTGLEYFH